MSAAAHNRVRPFVQASSRYIARSLELRDFSIRLRSLFLTFDTLSQTDSYANRNDAMALELPCRVCLLLRPKITLGTALGVESLWGPKRSDMIKDAEAPLRPIWFWFGHFPLSHDVTASCLRLAIFSRNSRPRVTSSSGHR